MLFGGNPLQPVKKREPEIPAPARGKTEAARVLSWRFESLIKSGYDSEAAWLIASEKTADLNVARQLREQGCPITTALLILL